MNVNVRPTFRALLLTAAASALVLSGCKEEKQAAPVEQPTETAKKEAALPKPTTAAEPRAETECAAPIDLAPPQELTVGDRSAKRTGYKLTFGEKDGDSQLVLGVLGALNEDSGENLVVLKKYLKFFQDEKVDAIVVTGDVGETQEGIARALTAVAESKLPVFVIAGNRECRADYTNGVLTAQKNASNIINMNQVRAVEFPEATLVSLPGYHDPNYMSCRTGCQYFKSTVDEVIRVAKEANNPVVLVAHGPPRGESSQALDHATSGGNVGDPEVARAINEGKIPFGVFSNIKEAGGRAVDSAAGTTLVAEGKPSKALYLNPGPADTVGWDMNDGTKSSGMAAILKLQGDQASWKLFRAKDLTAAEKKEAVALAPPKTAEPKEEAAQPTPPAGQPAQAAPSQTP